MITDGHTYNEHTYTYEASGAIYGWMERVKLKRVAHTWRLLLFYLSRLFCSDFCFLLLRFRYLLHAIALERVHFVITFLFFLSFAFIFSSTPSFGCVLCLYLVFVAWITRITSAFHVAHREHDSNIYVVKHPSNDYYPDDGDEDDRDTNGKYRRRRGRSNYSTLPSSSTWDRNHCARLCVCPIW